MPSPMLRSRLGVTAGLALTVLACSSDPRPPASGDCPAGDAGCTVHGGGAGTTGGDDAGSSSDNCTAAGSAASQCDQCAYASCCSFISACLRNADCSNLLSCVDACGSVVTCPDACETQYPDAVTLYDEIGSCVTVKCPVCSESGIGDPCSSGYAACQAGLTCNGAYCTEACSASSTCAGLGPGGGNASGAPNACSFVTGAGDTCAPTCASDSDCADFAGLYCKSTTAIEGTSVQVCSALPDGG